MDSAVTVHHTTWLPDIFDTSPYDLTDAPDAERCLDDLHALFRAAFVDSRPTMFTRPVTCSSGPGCGDGRGETFWHLTSKEQQGKGSLRERDWDRARLIRWPRPVIEAVAGRTDVRVWGTMGARQERKLKVAVDDFSYVVIMEDRPTEALLISAFHVPFKNYRSDLRKEWGRGPIVLPGTPPATA
jgi:hypothetical protein